MKKIKFTVDARLLRELGERLVGRPHIALAELVKNSYDADATSVVIRFEDDLIEIADNGHGMEFQDFKAFWMRVGSAHKEDLRLSRSYRRPLTGSKGIGRLAVQFLAREIELITVADTKKSSQLRAIVDWSKAVRAAELTRAEALYEQTTTNISFPSDSTSGTIIRLRTLHQTWDSAQLIDLAKEIWWLQPPFRPNLSLPKDQASAFQVTVDFPDKEAVETFNLQMKAIFSLWHARLVGRMGDWGDGSSDTTDVQLVLEFADGRKIDTKYKPDGFSNRLSRALFEIRVFHLQHRQPFGIQVSQAREYVNKYGGIHVYDAGFHLPYYGPERVLPR